MPPGRAADELLWIGLGALAVVVLFPVILLVVGMPMVGMMGWLDGEGTAGALSALWWIGLVLFAVVVVGGVGALLTWRAVGRFWPAPTVDRAVGWLLSAGTRGDESESESESESPGEERRESRDGDVER